MTIDTVEKVLKHIRDNPQEYPEFEPARPHIKEVANYGFVVAVEESEIINIYEEDWEIWSKDNPDIIFPRWEDLTEHSKETLKADINAGLQNDCFNGFSEIVTGATQRFFDDYSYRYSD